MHHVQKKGGFVSKVAHTALAALLAVTLCPTAAFAADQVAAHDATPVVSSVYVASQQGNDYLITPQKVEVSADLAESYGYVDEVAPETSVSTLDVLVKAHEMMFATDFTKDTAKTYLDVSESGMIAAMFAEQTSAVGFALDGEYPSDLSSPYDEQYGYTGYTVNQAPVAEGSTVDFFFYNDTSLYMDYYASFMKDGARVTEITAAAGEDISLVLEGYMYAYSGAYKPEEREEKGGIAQLEDAQIVIVDAQTGASEEVAGAITAAGGAVTFSLPEAGTYYVSAKPTVDSVYDFTSPWLAVTVVSAEDALVSSLLKGSGTPEDPYLIETTQDFADLQALSETHGIKFEGKTIAMADDLSLPEGWVPLEKFKGTFDGRNHVLSVPENGRPLLNAAEKAKVCNLSVYGPKIAGDGLLDNYSVGTTIDFDNVTIKAGTQTLESGFLGGYASGANAINITNCVVEKGVVIGYDKSKSNIGSFGGDFNGTIENCVSYADVYGVKYVGGIVGNKGQSVGTFTMKNCEFYGTVTATDSFAGGISGAGYGGTQWGTSSAPWTPCATIQNCLVAGTVTAPTNVGGILGGEEGVVQCWDNGVGFLQSNLFVGSVSATSDDGVAGAIVGYMNSLNKNNVIENNYYADTCGASAGIGAVQYIDTSCTDHETASGAKYFSTQTGAEYGEKPNAPKSDMNRTDDPLGADADALAKACSADELASGEVAKLLNEGAGSLGNWGQGREWPVHGESVAVAKIEVSGTFKTDYAQGEQLDLSGMTVTVTWSDGETTTVDPSKCEVEGYDPQAIGAQTLTISYAGATATFGVVVAAPENTIAVTFTLLGDSVHGADGDTHTLAGGTLATWVAKKSYAVAEGATVLDLLEQVCAANGIVIENPTGAYVKALTKDGVTLHEFDNGPRSGWMFSINGVHVDKSVAEQTLSADDVVVFHYTDDYTLENAMPEPDDPTRGFSDVEGHWIVLEGWLAQIVDRGLMSGIDGEGGVATGRFEPDSTLTRAMAATVLYRYANPGSDATSDPEAYGQGNPFPDVGPGMYYTAAVEWAKEAGIVCGRTSGAQAGLFCPEDPVTREELCKMIAEPGMYYTAAVEWAKEAGIVCGRTSGAQAGLFCPEDPVTREELCKMIAELARHMGAGGASGDPSALGAFPDGGEVSEWARGYVAWCAERGIVGGDKSTGSPTLRPADASTRAEAAKVVLGAAGAIESL